MKFKNIFIKVAASEDAVGWANMLLKLDKETKFTLFQPNERSSELSKYQNKILDSINNQKSIVFLVRDNELLKDNIVGYLCAEAYKINRKKHVVTVGIGILASYCSSGIGSQLITELIKHARDKNIKRMEAHVAVNNYRSVNFFKKFGFIIEGIKKKSIFLDDTYQNEYLMALTI